MPPSAKIESLLRVLRSRQGKRKSPYCLCEGLRCCRELISRAPEKIHCAIVRNDIAFELPEKCTCYRADERWFDQHAPTVQSQGILLIVERPPFIDDAQKSQAPCILVLDRITDPGNMGTLFRTAAASGLDEIWLTKGCCDPFSDKVIRASISLEFSLKLRFFETLNEAIEKAPSLGMDGAIFLTSPHEGENLFTVQDLYDRSLIVLGGEANGIDPHVPPHCRWVTLPMPGNEESLNVAQAATVFLFERVRRLYTQEV